ncbi:hypothetical protein L226DRAFT_559453 [Lentinus tigrinus ALCF2SS1-7]|uniref:F-box domain-containing protein n=1 Tax=Lentinus tigrinus ALCF2SS1-6 TaxID=1328759 RepID=A0A5C2SLH8_9APHY|nr:hypothetical protein L227DRAFT_598542 [Lentinus tigrinus ALCF2SS1-6]RPD76346.1 hypothetical protein L226DRAFT_559453 [Lentinus tigrinus ALCF2SS1-7]
MQEASKFEGGGHTRRALEDQIEAHSRAIIDIKTRLNMMTPVARLPPELLSTVFTLLAAESYETRCAVSMYTSDSYKTNIWIRVAHVCRHWRATALATPRLWSYIAITSKRAADELLARSKKAPLHLVANVPSHADDRQKAVKGVMAEFFRMRALHLTGSSQAICELFHKVSVPAPMLESVKLADRSPYHGYSMAMPLVLPADRAPRLRKLEVNGFLFSWDHPVFCPTLTSLLLCGRSGPEHQSLVGSFETFISALERMADLHVLVLEHVVPPAPSGAPSRKVPLMHLSSLRIQSGDAECRSLLDHLTLPANVCFHITVNEGVLGAANIFLALQNHLASSVPLRTACIEDTYGSRLSLKGWRAELQKIPPPYEPVQAADLHLETMTEGDRISTLLRPCTVFAGVTILDIRVEGPAHRWRWKDIFAGMPNIRHLLVSRDQDEEFIEALSHTDSDDPSTLALPRLKILKLDNMRLLSRDYDQPPEFLDLLIDALIKRCNWGSPLLELHIKECINIYTEDVARVEQIVPELTWDGVEEAEVSEEEDEDPYDGYGYGYDYDDDDIDDYVVDADDLIYEDLFFGGLY